MRKKAWMIALCLTAALSTAPAQALEYNVEAPDGGLFALPTSEHTVYVETEPANQDRSKNSALVPPGFGTPTSYLPGSGEPLTPNLADTSHSAGTVAGGWTVTGTGGVSGAGGAVLDGGAVDPGAGFVVEGSTGFFPSTAFTDVTSDLYYSGGHLGTLNIPAIGLSMKIYEGTGSSPLSKGAGHFEDTSIWDGNVALAGHNRGVTNHFGQIHTLDIGDRITLTTRLGTRMYEVVSVAQVGETDRSALASTSDNRITLYTCVRDQRELRWCVQGVEV